MTEKKHANVIEALTAVMDEMPGLGKAEKAPQGYAYRGIESITRAVQPLFAKHGVVFVPRVTWHEIRDIVVNGNPWTDTVTSVEYDIYGPGGCEDKITVGPILSIGRDNSDKGANKALTQAFKYALTQTLSISDGADDADAGSPPADEGTTPSVASKNTDQLASKPQHAKIAATLREKGIDDDVRNRIVASKWGGIVFADITKGQASEFIDFLSKATDEDIAKLKQRFGSERPLEAVK